MSTPSSHKDLPLTPPSAAAREAAFQAGQYARNRLRGLTCEEGWKVLAPMIGLQSMYSTAFILGYRDAAPVLAAKVLPGSWG
jgi:hypothetical protein